MIDYPKDPMENLRWREKLLRRCVVDLKFREQVRRLFHEDVLFAFNAFFYTLDVRRRPAHNLPFCTYDYQDETILELQRRIKLGSDLVIEKSRDMGATWMVLGTMFHFWMAPEGGADFLLGSRIEDYVDKKGDPRTHFAKLRYLLSQLPKWIKPRGFNPRAHDTFMKLVNPENGSTFTGESNNPNFSTQGRYLAILYDEFAKWEGSDESAWTAGGDASPTRIAVSTPFGAGGQFYSLVTSGSTKRITLHWRLHPIKAGGLSCVWPAPNELEERDRLGELFEPEEKLTSEWYEKQIERRSPQEIAQELDIDYLGAGHPVFDGRAWKSLTTQFKLPDKPKGFYFPTFERMSDGQLKYIAKPTEEPLDWEGYIIEYESFKVGASYAIGVDVATGKEEGDFSFIVVLDRVTKDVVAVYWGRCDEVLLAYNCAVVSDLYTPEDDPDEAPWLGIEAGPAGPGLATFDKAMELGISNLFMAQRYDVTKGGISYKKGWRTDSSTRPELVAGIREYLQDRIGTIHSQRVIGELMTFVRSRTGKPEAKSGCHDDAVFALGIAIQVDQLAPEVDKPEDLRDAKPSDYTMADLKSRILDHEPSLEEYCYATAVKKQNPMLEEELYWEGLY